MKCLAARMDAGTGHWRVVHSTGTGTGTGDPFVYATRCYELPSVHFQIDGYEWSARHEATGTPSFGRCCVAGGCIKGQCLCIHISYAQNAIRFLGTAMALWFVYGRPIPKDAKRITLYEQHSPWRPIGL
jgi:hypothetical protein